MINNKWKHVELPFGNGRVKIKAPPHADALKLVHCAALADPEKTIENSLRHPIASPSLAEITRQKVRANKNAQAVIVVSDNTRPVPYKGSSGILEPIIKILSKKGIKNLNILVANGTHRALDEAELKKFLPDRIFAGDIRVINHLCREKHELRLIGKTPRGSEIWINRHYLDADIKILTGLVEPHFMAGFSGGRKSICPGLIGEASTYIFHGPQLMADQYSDSLNLKKNPCHEESLAMARAAGADFMVNVTLNGENRVTGVFAGDMEKAHLAAIAKVKNDNAIGIAHEYDLVITHAGFVGINHYQAAKAAVEAAKAVKRGGTIILLANNTDKDPVGSSNYKAVLPLLRRLGPDGLNARLGSNAWAFIPEQWEVQMWARVLKKLGSCGKLIYCSPQLTGPDFEADGLPGTDGGSGLEISKDTDTAEIAQSMAQRAIEEFYAENTKGRIAILEEGPYGVPFLKKTPKRTID